MNEHKLFDKEIKKDLFDSIYPDPNLYLTQDPVKKKYCQLALDVDYTHIIISRFSYRFRKGDPIGNLFDKKRMERRFDLFESFCYPSITKQTNPNFYWILIVDMDLPNKYLDRLNYLIAKFYESEHYSTRGPRQIFVHKWTYQYPLSNPDFFKDYIPVKTKFLVTTRFDDDDSLCKDFIQMIAHQTHKEIDGFKLISYPQGYYWYAHPNLSYGMYKTSNRPYIAIGLTLITEYEKYPLTVYFGNHTKLHQYIRKYEDHRILRELCHKNGEVITEQNYPNKVNLVKKSEPVYIRTVHDHNLQLSEKNRYNGKRNPLKVANNLKSTTVHNLTEINKKFNLNLKKIKKVNKKI